MCGRMLNNTVIFIGGTNYSGTTLLDYYLSNDDEVFSLGEIYALYRPFKKHHVDFQCSCFDDNCNLWEQLRERGECRLYEQLISCRRENVFIDSSKNIDWFKFQQNILEKRRVPYLNILIWKPPDDYLESAKRRDKDATLKSWINYHKLYLKNFSKNFVSVNYNDFIHGEEIKRRLCSFVNLKYTKDKIYYWNKNDHHTLFGNSRAKINFYNKDEKGYEFFMEDLISNNNINKDFIAKTHRILLARSKDFEFKKISYNQRRIINNIEKQQV